MKTLYERHIVCGNGLRLVITGIFSKFRIGIRLTAILKAIGIRLTAILNVKTFKKPAVIAARNLSEKSQREIYGHFECDVT